MDKITVTQSAQETRAIAEQFAACLKKGDVICLHGDLGAGKTTWVKGLAAGLGLAQSETVTSPTFALMHRYSSRIPLYHFDCYRIESSAELSDIGFEEFLSDREAIVCIEWPEKAGKLIPKIGWDVFLKHCGGEAREIRISKK